jgi:hypothetical protein
MVTPVWLCGASCPKEEATARAASAKTRRVFMPLTLSTSPKEWKGERAGVEQFQQFRSFHFGIQ